MTSFCGKTKYRVVVMGAAAVGKSSIISRFMYEKFIDSYKATVEEFHQGVYEVNGVPIQLEILDTAGAYDFPAMRQLSISTGDAFILVYSVDDESSFQEVKRLREQIIQAKGEATPQTIVIVGNKADCVPEKRVIRKEEAESTANIDWENGFVEVSAKDDINIKGVFQELLVQAKVSLKDKPSLKRNNTAPLLVRHKKKPSKLEKRNSCTIA